MTYIKKTIHPTVAKQVPDGILCAEAEARIADLEAIGVETSIAVFGYGDELYLMTISGREDGFDVTVDPVTKENILYDALLGIRSTVYQRE